VTLDDATSGAFTYTPDPGFNGDDTFTFRVNDGEFDSAIATATITVGAVNDAPTFTTGGDQTVLEDAAAQNLAWATSIDDGDPGDQVLTFSLSNDNNALFSGQPAIAADGTLSYTPAADANGSATVTVSLSDDGGIDNSGADTSSASTFTITVTAVNDAPTFTVGADRMVDEDSGAQTIAGGATTISAGPTDEAGQTVSFYVSNSDNTLFEVQPAIDSTGTLTFTPALDKNGTATVTVSLSDNGGTADGGIDTSATQTFGITITGVNDPPVVDPVQLTINEDGSATRTLTVSDPDGDASFTYAVTTQPSGGMASFSDTVPGQFTYTPDLDFNGEDQFTVTVTDTSGGGGGATVTITVTAENDEPVAFPQSVETNEDTPIAVTLTAVDVENDTLTYAVVNGPSHGALSGTAPNLVYTPAENYFGGDSFTFTANDGEFDSTAGTVTINVVEINDPPVAVPDAVTVNQNSGANVLDLLVNDIDVEFDPFTVLAAGQPTNGVTAIVGGTVTYTPNVNFVGDDSFQYTIGDVAGRTSTATVTVTVQDPVPDYGFIGLLEPWRPNNYRVKAGLAIPIKWYYTTAPGSEAAIDSAGALPLIRIRGPFGCGPNDDDADAVDIVEDAGSSDLRYSGDSWQFNWDSKGLEAGCYNIRITSQETSQIDGPFKVQLR